MRRRTFFAALAALAARLMTNSSATGAPAGSLYVPLVRNQRLPTVLPSDTPRPTATATHTPTSTPSATHTPTPTATRTPTPTATWSDEDGTVYITATGDKYHRGTCRYVSKSKIPKSCAWVKAHGYTPCSVCKPHCP